MQVTVHDASIKPILEILAGIPTIVFGFFALTFVTPVLRSFIPGLGEFNAISPGLVVGIMIVPITSLVRMQWHLYQIKFEKVPMDLEQLN